MCHRRPSGCSSGCSTRCSTTEEAPPENYCCRANSPSPLQDFPSSTDEPNAKCWFPQSLGFFADQWGFWGWGCFCTGFPLSAARLHTSPGCLCGVFLLRSGHLLFRPASWPSSAITVIYYAETFFSTTFCFYLKVSLAVCVQGLKIRSWSWDEAVLPPSVLQNEITLKTGVITVGRKLVLKWENYLFIGPKHSRMRTGITTHKEMITVWREIDTFDGKSMRGTHLLLLQHHSGVQITVNRCKFLCFLPSVAGSVLQKTSGDQLLHSPLKKPPLGLDRTLAAYSESGTHFSSSKE